MYDEDKPTVPDVSCAHCRQHLRKVHDLYAYDPIGYTAVWLCFFCLKRQDPEWAQSVKDMEAFMRVYDAEKKLKDQKKRERVVRL